MQTNPLIWNTAMHKFLALLMLFVSASTTAEVTERQANNGNLLMQDVPDIPHDIAESLNRYQAVRSASFRAWTADSQHLYVTTRFGDVDQVHRVDQPGGTRRQLTYFNEPVGEVVRQPQHNTLTFTRDTGGSEFAQIFSLEPGQGTTRQLTDGTSRNGTPVWDRPGARFAYTSTRRNGASNDIWIMNPDQPEQTTLVLPAPDGTYWGPVEFSADGKQLLVLNYVSINDSRAHVLDLATGNLTQLAGRQHVEPTSVNIPVGFDDDKSGFWLLTNQAGEFTSLAWQALESGAQPEIVADLPWDVEAVSLSQDRQRGMFVVNEGGQSAAYLFDPSTRKYKRAPGLPVGVIASAGFSPDGSKLALTLNSARSPSDTYVLDLGKAPLKAKELTRWTFSEVGGLDTDRFVAPDLITYPTFDEVDGEQRQIPAWLYKPKGQGPFPVVISIHGGPEGQARPTFSSTYQLWLAKLGAAVLVPNVRGSSGYGKTYVASDNGFNREHSVQDIGALLDWIAEQPDLDASRVAVFGGSYGGYMVLASSVHYSDRLKAAVDIVGISNFVTFLTNTQSYRRDLRRAEYGDERDPDMRAFLQKISPLTNVEKISVPMFVVQGENDPRVPVTESIQLVQALRDQGNTVWYMNALNEGHGFRKKENRDIYQQATVLFLKRYLVD